VSSRTTSGNVSRAALRETLLTVEIAVTVVLLIGAGLLLRSFVRLRGANVGCVTNHVLTLDLNLPVQKYGSPQKLNAFNETLLEKLRVTPGIRAVALGSNLPGEGFGSDDDFTIKEHPPLKPGEGIPDALARWADPGYFSALQIPLLSGRFFTSGTWRSHGARRAERSAAATDPVRRNAASNHWIGNWIGSEYRNHATDPLNAI
jgi:hypothetical protein